MWSRASAQLPGSPDGLGEIQAFVQHGPTGRSGAMLEVIDFETGRRAVTRDLTSAYPGGGELVIEPLGHDACRVTQMHCAQLPAGVTCKAARVISALPTASISATP
jgi:hypothetical protein